MVGEHPSEELLAARLPDGPVRVKCRNVVAIDGDTLRADLILGLGLVFERQILRLAGIDAPELRSPNPGEREQARRAKEFVEELLIRAQRQVEAEITGKGKYGRWLAQVYVGNKCLNDELLRRELADRYEA